MGNLAGKTILVTGATSGIGEAASIYFVGQGAHVVALARNDLKLKKLKDTSPFKIATVCCDLKHEQGTLIDAKIDGLFHCAGSELLMPASRMDRQTLDDLMHVSVSSVYMLIMSLLVKKPVGQQSIVLMSSIAGRQSASGMTGYSAVKGATDSLTKSLAAEYAPYIRVNSIVAGGVETPMHERIRRMAGTMVMQEYLKRHPLGFGQPIDIAKAAAFLLSDDSRWITGTNMIVDGGYSCR